MMLILSLVVGTLLVLFTASLIQTSRFAVARAVASLLGLGFAAFCAFGFFASLEPTGLPNWPWQVGYGVLGLGSLAAVALALLRGGRRSSSS